MAAGNGAAMRIAPLAFVLDPLSSSDRVTIRDVCRITHHSDEAYIGALAILVSLRLPEEVAPPAFLHIAGVLPDSLVRDRLIAFSELPPRASLSSVSERFGSSGYVVDTVPLALLAASRMTASSLEGILGELVQAGGDTDTIGALAGQLAGARLGCDNLPSHLVALPQVQSVLPTAEAFSRCVRGGA